MSNLSHLSNSGASVPTPINPAPGLIGLACNAVIYLNEASVQFSSNSDILHEILDSSDSTPACM